MSQTACTKEKLANVLLVEDSLADIALVTAKMEIDHVHFNMEAVRDGEEAIDFLGRCNGDEGSPLPDIIFLDLNLPKISGRETLRHIRQQPELQHIPTVVLSGSDYDDDIRETREIGASYYLVKPLDYEKLCEAVPHLSGVYFTSDGQEICLCSGAAAHN